MNSVWLLFNQRCASLGTLERNREQEIRRWGSYSGLDLEYLVSASGECLRESCSGRKGRPGFFWRSWSIIPKKAPWPSAAIIIIRVVKYSCLVLVLHSEYSPLHHPCTFGTVSF